MEVGGWCEDGGRMLTLVAGVRMRMDEDGGGI